MLFKQIGQILDVTGNSGRRHTANILGLLDNLDQALICAKTLGNFSDEQCAGVQALLIFGAVEVSSSQTEHGSVVPPQEEADDDVEDVGANDKDPIDVARDVERSQAGKGRDARGHVGGSDEVDRDDGAATDNSNTGEDVPAHLCKAKEQGGVHANLVDQLLLFCF